MKQTAVEWLEVQIKNSPTVENLMNQLDAFIQEAKEMEKKQIKNAYWDGGKNEYEYHINDRKIKNSEQYYNEQFKNK